MFVHDTIIYYHHCSLTLSWGSGKKDSSSSVCSIFVIVVVRRYEWEIDIGNGKSRWQRRTRVARFNRRVATRWIISEQWTVAGRVASRSRVLISVLQSAGCFSPSPLHSFFWLFEFASSLIQSSFVFIIRAQIFSFVNSVCSILFSEFQFCRYHSVNAVICSKNYRLLPSMNIYFDPI